MLFFLYKSGRGWTIPDRTSCACCELITGAARRTNTAAPRGRGGHGAGPPHRAHRGRPRGADTERRQPRVPGDTGRDRAARPGSLMSLTPGLRWVGPAALPPHRGTFWQLPLQPPLIPPRRGTLGTPTAPGSCAKHGRAGGHLLKRGHVDVVHQGSTFWGICDPLKFRLQDCAQSGYCHPCHAVPVLGRREVHGLGH